MTNIRSASDEKLRLVSISNRCSFTLFVNCFKCIFIPKKNHSNFVELYSKYHNLSVTTSEYTQGKHYQIDKVHNKRSLTFECHVYGVNVWCVACYACAHTLIHSVNGVIAKSESKENELFCAVAFINFCNKGVVF